MSFDTLSFAKRLTEAGEKPAVAEAHAIALKEFVMGVIATKSDLRDIGRRLGEEVQDARDDIQEARQEIVSFRQDVNARSALKAVQSSESLLHKDIDVMISKLTLRCAGMLAVAVGVVVTLSKMI